MSLQHLCSRDHPLGDGELVESLGRVAPLLQVNVLDVLAGEVVFAVRVRLELFEHNVVDVQPVQVNG